MTTVLTKIAVCGAGAMGSGIAQIAAQAGAEVMIFDVNPDALSTSRARILGDLDKLAARGKIGPDEAAAISGRLSWVTSLDALADRDLVLEAIVEDAGIKGALFAQLEAIVAPETIIATNTSSLPVSRLARGLQHRGRFAGMHFFNPATLMKLVEVIAGVATEQAAVDRIVATAKAWGKIAVPVADVPGFIVNRVARPYYAEAFTALSEGVDARDIDALFRGVGFKMGPMELTDLIGQDVNFAVARSVFDSYFGRGRFVPQLAQAALVDAGRLGRKTGHGVYDYSAAEPSPQPPEPAAIGVGSGHREVATAVCDAPPGTFFDCGDVAIGKTRGLTARAESRLQSRPIALLDWHTVEKAASIGFSVSSAAAYETAVAVAAALGARAIELPDRPGLLVARTLAQVANGAADAVLERVSDETGVDSAMIFGANYPIGPFGWSDLFGRQALVGFLDSVADGTGEAMYRPSHYLRNGQ